MRKLFYMWMVGALLGGLVLAQPAWAAPPQCEVHHVAMQEKWVKVMYGLPVVKPGYDEALSTTFPNSNRTALGGCAHGTKRRTREYVCPRCRKAETAWHAAHPRTPARMTPSPSVTPPASADK